MSTGPLTINALHQLTRITRNGAGHSVRGP